MHKVMRKYLFVLILPVAMLAFDCVCIAAWPDVNDDYYVDIYDLAEVAQRWLAVGCEQPQWCFRADIDKSGEVNLDDIAFMAIDWQQNVDLLQNLGFVVVSPDGPEDGGDFGPKTPNTQTSGIQEAFNFAKMNGKEVYIVGGGVNDTASVDPVVYDISTTLNIPWGQSWRCDGGEYIMNFTITNGDCLVIDSQKNSQLKFGAIVAKSLESGSIVKIAPMTNGPDSTKICGSSKIKINSIVGGGSMSGDVYAGKGIGLHLGATDGAIVANEIFINQISGCEQGILLDNVGGADMTQNKIDCLLVSSCDTLLQVEMGSYNKINAGLQPDPSGAGVVGANLVGGESNTYTLAWLEIGGFDPGDALKFGSGARDNLIYSMNLPTDGITNNASIPTNRIAPAKSVGFNVATPSITEGVDIVNDSSYTIVATILTSGNVTSWTLKDSFDRSRTVSSGLQAGQALYLEPGEKTNRIYGKNMIRLDTGIIADSINR